MKTKNINKLAMTLVIVCTALSLFTMSCSKDKETALDVAKKQIKAGEWTLQSVTVDGVDKTSMYQNMKITFSEGSFSCTNGGVVWGPSGTWSFSDQEGKMITRGDGLEIQVNTLSATQLVITLTWTKTTYSGGRTGSISGVHVFSFVR